MPLPPSMFEPEADETVLLVTGLDVKPFAFRDRDNNDVTQDLIELECDDLTARFVPKFTCRFKGSKNSNSKWMRWKMKCEHKIGYAIRKTEDILGKYYLTELGELRWQIEGEPEERVARLVPFFVEELTQEEAEGKAAKIRGGSATEAASSDLSDFQRTVLANLDGNTYPEFLQVAVEGNLFGDDLTSVLSPDNPTVEALLEFEHLTKDESGVYHVA